MSDQLGTDATARVNKELKGAARGGAVTLLGSSFSTLMGFVLALVLARGLGADGSGVVLQAVAVFMIGLAIARLGMDTTAVWILPRIRTEAAESVRGAVSGVLLSTAVTGILVAVGWWTVAWMRDGDVMADDRVTHAISAIVWLLPVGSVMLVGLAATRGFGGVLPFNLIGNIAVPAARPLGVGVVAALGGGYLAAAYAWALPLAPGLLLALLVLSRQVRRFERRRHVKGALFPTRALLRRLLGFALPRTLSSVLEQSIVWLNVVLVGALAGSAAAGVFGAASRFVAAGVIVLTALRIVVAPQFSALLSQERTGEVQNLYTVTSTWILLFGAPIYVLLASFSPTVLGWLGPDFGDGVTSMMVLCLGAIVLLAGGNIQSLLLMSGRSGWGAVNKMTVFTANVVGNVLMVPRFGILGAAVTWAVCMSLDTALAMFQVRRFTGVRPALGRIALTLAAVAACTAVPAMVTIALRGNNTVSFVLATLASAVLMLAYCVVDRRRLHLDELVGSLRSRR